MDSLLTLSGTRTMATGRPPLTAFGRLTLGAVLELVLLGLVLADELDARLCVGELLYIAPLHRSLGRKLTGAPWRPSERIEACVRGRGVPKHGTSRRCGSQRP